MATHVATRGAKEVIPKVLPPSSPFAELLRRSKFATFDPSIRQTYSAPHSYTHRGNYGLKRPIANRKAHGYIVLKNFEEHAQYIEWDNAKEQVRWLNMVEEMNVAPQLKLSNSWAEGLGPLGTSRESGLDSEFCPGEGPQVVKIRKELVMNESLEVTDKTTGDAAVELAPKHPPNLPPSMVESPISVDVLPPTRGKGAYGAKAEIITPEGQGRMFLQPNISAMSPKVFRRYIEKLRKMRPEFLTFVRAELKKTWVNNKRACINPDILTDEELVAQVGSSLLDQKYHLRFLGFKSEANYHAKPPSGSLSAKERSKLQEEALQSANSPQPIRPQPHKFAGLMYAQPTTIETQYSTKPQPGIYLQYSSTRNHVMSEKCLASFGGLTASLGHVGVGAKPLFESETGANLSNLPQSTRMMRVTSLMLANPPTVVGRSARSNPLVDVHMRVSVADDAGVNRNQRDNPHPPGSYEYNSLVPPPSLKRGIKGGATFMSRIIPSRAHAPIRTQIRAPWGGSLVDGGLMYDTKTNNTQSRVGSFKTLTSKKGEDNLQRDLQTMLNKFKNGGFSRQRKREGSFDSSADEGKDKEPKR